MPPRTHPIHVVAHLTSKYQGLHQVERLLIGPDGAQAVRKASQSSLIQSLREQQAHLEGRAAELSREYGGMNSQIVNIRAKAEDLRRKIADEGDRIE
jgi:uncharacterized protein involved in exopolysaccharide biosynthesis